MKDFGETFVIVDIQSAVPGVFGIHYYMSNVHLRWKLQCRQAFSAIIEHLSGTDLCTHILDGASGFNGTHHGDAAAAHGEIHVQRKKIPHIRAGVCLLQYSRPGGAGIPAFQNNGCNAARVLLPDSADVDVVAVKVHFLNAVQVFRELEFFCFVECLRVRAFVTAPGQKKQQDAEQKTQQTFYSR